MNDNHHIDSIFEEMLNDIRIIKRKSFLLKDE